MTLASAINLCCAAPVNAGKALTARPTQAVFPVEQGGKHGAIDVTGKVIVPIEFDEPVVAKEGLVRVRKGQRTAYLSLAGERVIGPQAITHALPSEGRIVAYGPDDQGRNRYGYWDLNGGWAITPRFEHAGDFLNGLAVVGNNDEWGRTKYGYCDPAGELVIAAVYDKAQPFGTQLALVETAGRRMLIDREGRDRSPAGFDWFGAEREGFVQVRLGKLFGVVDATGKTVAAPRFTALDDYKDGRARFWESGAFGFINTKGEIVIPATLAHADAFSEGLAAVRIGEKVGFMDGSGRVVVEAKLDQVRAFSDGVAMARLGKLWGFIDREGRWRIEPRFSWARPFQNGLAWVGLPGAPRGQYIDVAGRTVWREGP
ncbi:MAG: WG repeat-containing protein [Betaproteobacteria bacterium]|nr:WG repeat-containing protein [Betaproteobacteria bacterium]